MRPAPVTRFSLRNLLAYMLGVCAYLSAMLEITRQADVPFSLKASFVGPLVASWILLAIVYIAWRLNGILFIHCLAPLGAFAIAVGIAAVQSSSSNVYLIQAVCGGCFFGTFVSFPTAVLLGSM